MDRYICVDVETTGLNPKTDRIIEIGVARVEDGHIVDTFSSLIHPGIQISERVSELTGITNEMVEDAPDICRIIPHFMDFIGEDIWLGQNIIFDYAFLKKAALQNGYPLERKAVDTLKLARRFMPELESKTLGSLCDHFHIEHEAHRAMGDVLATVQVYAQLQKRYKTEETLQDFLPKSLQYAVKKETPITIRQLERLSNMIKKGNIVCPYEIEKMSRSEASRYMDQLVLQYGRSYFS